MPTIADSKEHYHVSAVTVRSAYQILNEIGLTRTVNGKGTRVLGLPEDTVPIRTQYVSSSRTSGYLEAIEFFRIVCSDVINYAATINFSKLHKDIIGVWNPAHHYSLMILLYHIFKGAGVSTFVTIYKVAIKHLYWGIYIQGIPAFGDMCESNHEKCMEIACLLEQGNTTSAAAILHKLLETLYPIV